MSEAVVDGALVLAGRYALRDPIAKGGMAVVWRASDLRLHRDVAVKVLTQSEDSDRDRVLREARLLAATGHPSIVQVLDVGVDAGRPFIVMELLEGASLARTLARGPVAAPEALTILASALDGLSIVHARGIVHRDLKPENLFLARDPSVPDDGSLLGGKRLKILDFGVSRATDRRTEVRSALTTREGALVGTPEYMAPEQARGLPEVGPAADLHALGVILFELLTLQRPYQSPHPGDLIIAIATQPPPLLSEFRPDLPASLGALIRRALAKSPDDRFASAQAMRAAVQEVRDELARARVPSTPDGVAVRAAALSDERSEAITVEGVTPLAAGLLAPERAALDTPPAEPASSQPARRRELAPIAIVVAVLASVGLLALFLGGGQGASPSPSVDSSRTASMPDDASTASDARLEPDAAPSDAGSPASDAGSDAGEVARDAPAGTRRIVRTPPTTTRPPTSELPGSETPPRFRDLDY